VKKDEIHAKARARSGGRDLGIEGLVELEVLGLESKNLLAELGLNLNLLVLQEKKRKKGLIGS